MQTKICTTCGVEKTIDNFYKKKRGLYGVSGPCKECASKYYKDKYSTEERRIWNIRSRYGISYEEVLEMYKNQGCKCLICGEYNDKVAVAGGLIVDHSHLTGMIRGLVCYSCNILLGLCDDRIEVLESAIKYLNKFGDKKI